MGVSTDGQLSFGIMFDEGFQFPWTDPDDEEGDGGLAAWWRRVNNMPEPAFYPYTEDGKYKQGVLVNDPRIDEYFLHRSDWLKANPIPIDLVEHCSISHQMYIISVPGLRFTASRGFPLEIAPEQLQVTCAQRQLPIIFCEKWGIDMPDQPKWWLSSLAER